MRRRTYILIILGGIFVFLLGFVIAVITENDMQTERLTEICKNQNLEYKSNEYFQCFDSKTNSFVGPIYKKN